MELSGTISDGVVKLDQPCDVAEGTKVRVQVPTSPVPQPSSTDAKPRSLLDVLGDLVGKAEGLPPDAAINVDHYLYGLPKR